MIRDYFVAFDFVAFDQFQTSDTFSSDVVAARLGRYDKLALQAVVDKMSTYSGTDTLTVDVLQSADGEAWGFQASSVITGTVHDDATDVFFGYMAPSLPFLRLRVKFGVGGTTGHVKIYAVLRDPSD